MGSFLIEQILVSIPNGVLLEFLILVRLQPLSEANIPHVNESAYRKRVSCDDTIFATQEVIARYIRG